MSKITDLISLSKGLSFSYEVTPDFKYDEIKKIDVKPLFLSVTWHAQAQDFKDFDIPSLKLATLLRNAGYNVLLHVPCSFMKRDYLSDLLNFLQDNDICNLFIIQGQKYDQTTSDFANSQELIKYIRELTGSYFCIGVAGFPNQDEKLPQLKEKIEFGVDFILTQAFFELQAYENFVFKCKQLDINIPILPGIFPFETKSELQNFINICKINVSEDILEDSKHSGIDITTKLIYDLTKSSINTRHFHLFKLNKMHIASEVIKSVNNKVHNS